MSEDIDGFEERLARVRAEVQRTLHKTKGQNHDLVAVLGDILRDAKLLRTHSVNEGVDGSVKIKSPMYFTTSIKLRLDLVNSAVTVMREVLDLQKQQDFYDMVMKEVQEEAPEVVERVARRLARLLNNEPIMIGPEP